MKEQDVRQRIESFLKRTARELIIPASVGLSLGLSGCSDAVYKYGTLFLCRMRVLMWAWIQLSQTQV